MNFYFTISRIRNFQIFRYLINRQCKTFYSSIVEPNSMALPFLYALLIGFITSIPLGAVGSFMINRYRSDGWWGGLSVAIFSSIVDSCACGISLFGLSLISISPLMIIIVKSLGLGILLFVGLKQLYPSDKELSFVANFIRFGITKNKYFYHTKNAFIVFFLALCNPTLLAFWINLSHLIQTTLLVNSRVQDYLLFSTIVGIGSALCQIISLWFLHKAHNINDKVGRVIHWISLSIFILTTSYFGIHIIKELFTLIHNL